MKLRGKNILLLLALLATAIAFCGCSSTVPANASARPWNAPQGWGYGLSGMNMQQPTN